MSDWHDVENNLAFPPRENTTSNNLTDDWKAEKLNHGWYWVRTVHGFVKPVYYLITRAKGELVKGFAEEPEDRVEEVLARCDYDHFVELTEKVKELEKYIQTLTNNYKLLEKEQAADIAHGQALVDDFGDFEALYEELQRLRKIAAKYDHIKVKGNYPDKISKLKSRIKHLLELQANQDKELESARWYQTIQNEDIAKLRQLLKECQKVLSYYGNSNLPCDCSSNIHYDNQTALNLLTRINEALK